MLADGGGDLLLYIEARYYFSRDLKEVREPIRWISEREHSNEREQHSSKDLEAGDCWISCWGEAASRPEWLEQREQEEWSREKGKRGRMV